MSPMNYYKHNHARRLYAKSNITGTYGDHTDWCTVADFGGGPDGPWPPPPPPQEKKKKEGKKKKKKKKGKKGKRERGKRKNICLGLWT